MNDIIESKPQPLTRASGPQPIYPNDYESAWRMAVAISKSGLAPKGIQTPEALFTAMQLGAEVGLSPMSALQNIAVVNGRPTIWGDAQLALVRASGQLEDFIETRTGEGDALVAKCIAKRVGYATPSEASFSVEDAKKAGLWGKDGPWKTNPKRMLQMRARAFALRDGFTDILKGIYSTEEARDIPAMVDVTPMASTEDLNKEFLSGEEKPTAVSVPVSGQTQARSEPIAENVPPFLASTPEKDELSPAMELNSLMEAIERAEPEARVALFLERNGQELFEKTGSNKKTAEVLKKLGVNVITGE